MKLKTEQVLKNLDGENMKEGENRILTIGMVLSGALVSPGEKKLNPIEAMDRYGLAMDLRAKKEVELSSEQIVMCKEAVCQTFSPLISGQVCIMLK